MRTTAALVATALALAACAAPVTPLPSPPGPIASSGDDCAVIAAVAKEHYRFNGADNVPPPLWLDGGNTGWGPRCDWGRHGLTFPAAYDADRPPRAGERIRWVSFKQPRYDGRGAMIETAIMHGPMAGMGYECRVISGFAGWTVGECGATWVS